MIIDLLCICNNSWHLFMLTTCTCMENTWLRTRIHFGGISTYKKSIRWYSKHQTDRADVTSIAKLHLLDDSPSVCLLNTNTFNYSACIDTNLPLLVGHKLAGDSSNEDSLNAFIFAKQFVYSGANPHSETVCWTLWVYSWWQLIRE